jgi:hypothetical protein
MSRYIGASRCIRSRSTILLLLILLLLVGRHAQAQIKDSLKTGFLPDAAEEYWPATNHISIREGKGFISVGAYFREVYELFDNYLWGIGPQGHGYFLHRAIVHADVRYNKNIRAFVQVQSSFLSGRIGGPRPVQDLDKLAVDQVFGEYSFRSANKSLFSFRLGKQALNYGVGSLLDIRETNVRRSFFGGKFIAEHKNTKIDLFAMELIQTNPGFLDDKVDRTQKIAGVWVTQTFPQNLFTRLDAYYLYTHRDSVTFARGLGTESRHTVGTALNFIKDRWSGYTELDFQFGRFDKYSILAWKFTQTLTYQLNDIFSKPAWSAQCAMSSGDRNLQEGSLNTFNPIYPKAIYYGYIDNVGSANIFLIHGKMEVEPVKKLKLTASYYTFWRQSIVDGLYAGNGSFFLASTNDQRRVGSMMDVVAFYAPNGHFSLRGVVTYYKRGPFLREDPITAHDIRYLGMTTILKL